MSEKVRDMLDLATELSKECELIHSSSANKNTGMAVMASDVLVNELKQELIRRQSMVSHERADS